MDYVTLNAMPTATAAGNAKVTPNPVPDPAGFASNPYPVPDEAGFENSNSVHTFVNHGCATCITVIIRPFIS